MVNAGYRADVRSLASSTVTLSSVTATKSICSVADHVPQGYSIEIVTQVDRRTVHGFEFSVL